MLRIQYSETVPLSRNRMAGAMGVFAVGALLAGCSADIARLDSPVFGVNESVAPRPSEPIGRRNAGAPAPFKNDGWSESGPRAASLPPLDPNISQTSLPPLSGGAKVAALPSGAGPSGVGPSVPFDVPKSAANKSVAIAAAPVKSNVQPGGTIDVQPGDTVYGLSKKHSVSMAAIMELNGLKSPSLRPGQKLVLPANAKRPLIKTAALPAPVTPVGAPVASQLPARVPSAAAPVASAPAVSPTNGAAWTGSHTVLAGESLYGIARKHKVKLADLQSVNGITEPLKVRPGAMLKVPASDGVPVATPAAPAVVAQPSAPAAPTPLAAAPGVSPAVPGVKILNTPQAPAAQPEAKVAALGAPKVDVPPIAVSAPAAVPQTSKAVKVSTGATKFSWPVKGNVITNFGKRTDGTHNDGINIAVPAGTDVMAADGGVIAYAGSELKGYGNLVLVRHENGWVSAYAHADEVLVKRGDTVKRGQVIAKAGKTGSVDKPQVHFELRQGSAPVDPLPHMEKN
ncbi:MAG: peptidoglycan DD-metalloendopeptidase family protein [Hyphomicrobiaceae bacterium]